MPNDKKPWEDYIESKKEAEARPVVSKPGNSDPLERGRAIMRGLFGSRKPEETNMGSGLLGRATDAIKDKNKKLKEAY